MVVLLLSIPHPPIQGNSLADTPKTASVKKSVEVKPATPAPTTQTPAVTAPTFDAQNPATWPKCADDEYVRADNGQCAKNAAQASSVAQTSAPGVDNGWHYQCISQMDAVHSAVIAAGLGDQWTYINYIFGHESCNDPGRLNSIGAKGLGQSLGHDSFTCGSGDIACQITWFNSYAVGKFGSWYGAYEYWLAHGNW